MRRRGVSSATGVLVHVVDELDQLRRRVSRQQRRQEVARLFPSKALAVEDVRRYKQDLLEVRLLPLAPGAG